MNPFYDAHETSLGRLSEAEWNALRGHWSMFSGLSFCRKLGRKWTVEGFGINGPLFKTKAEAERYVSNLICAEARSRRRQQWERENGTA